MKTDRPFFDTNVLLYLLSEDNRKAAQLSHKKLTCSSMETKASGESVNFSIVA